MKILLAASEVAPIIKIGGLGDVIGSMPKALEQVGVNVDVVVPYFPTSNISNLNLYKSIELNVPFDGSIYIVEVWKTKLPESNVDVFLLKNDEFFSQGGKSYYSKNLTETEMFSFFDRSVVEYIKTSFNTYDIIHCNDWHTGLITHMLKDELGDERPKTLFTIHNLMYQGVGDVSLVKQSGFVPGEHPLIDWDILDGDLNMIQQGITSSDYLSTVSPTYAKEILTPEYGGEFFEILKSRESRMFGILNGIDYSFFPRDYDISTWELGKKIQKVSLQKTLGLELNNNIPIISFVGRIDPGQKGIDIIYETLPHMMKEDVQIIILGTGDKSWEDKLVKYSLESGVSKKFSCNMKFDVKLANLIYSGSDFLLVPSKYEPCGLIQMISMWYGTLPIVRDTGGLKDSVENNKTGFVFEDYSSKSMFDCIKNALDTYKSPKMSLLIRNTLNKDFSWKKSALEYQKMYNQIINS